MRYSITMSAEALADLLGLSAHDLSVESISFEPGERNVHIIAKTEDDRIQPAKLHYDSSSKLRFIERTNVMTGSPEEEEETRKEFTRDLGFSMEYQDD